jgi:hypothetical protein
MIFADIFLKTTIIIPCLRGVNPKKEIATETRKNTEI